MLPHAQEHAQRMLEAMVDYRIKCVEEPHNQALHYASISALPRCRRVIKINLLPPFGRGY